MLIKDETLTIGHVVEADFRAGLLSPLVKRHKMSDTITSELLATPRLLVVRANDKTPRTFLELTLLEVSPSGLRIRYKMPRDASGDSGYWTDVGTFELVEVLNNR
jgi:hypothetical protein